MALTPDDSLLYVAGDDTGTVNIIDTSVDLVTGSIDVGPNPHGLAITPDGATVLVAVFGGDLVSAFDVTTNEPTWSAPVSMPHSFAISPDGSTAYVASMDPTAPSLAILSLPDQLMVDSVPLDSVPLSLDFTADGSQLWFTQAGVDEVQVLDPPSHSIMASIPVGAGAGDLTFTQTGLLGLAVSEVADSLSLLDPETDTNLATVSVGPTPHWVAATADGLIAFVTDVGSDALSVVNLTAGVVTDTIFLGATPNEIVVQSVVAVTTPAPPVTQPEPTPTTPVITPAPPPSTVSVGIAQFAFSPATVTIAAGESVTWTNMDPTDHTTTSDSLVWDSEAMPPGATFTTTFDQPGTFTYTCEIHPFMHGTVIVTG
jgi:YVTN family beta-propeller protein